MRYSTPGTNRVPCKATRLSTISLGLAWRRLKLAGWRGLRIFISCADNEKQTPRIAATAGSARLIMREHSDETLRTLAKNQDKGGRLNRVFKAFCGNEAGRAAASHPTSFGPPYRAQRTGRFELEIRGHSGNFQLLRL